MQSGDLRFYINVKVIIAYIFTLMYAYFIVQSYSHDTFYISSTTE